ncbi:unnamed protein product, partial [marine sediment metagenome]
MAVNEKDIAEFDDMFDLSSDKTDDGNEQAEEYGHSTESAEPFESLAKEVSEDIQENESKGHALATENPHDIVKEICSDGAASIPIQEEPEEVKEPPVEEPPVEEPPVEEPPVEEVSDDGDDDFFDELPVQKKEPAKEEPAEEEPVEDTMLDDADVEPEVPSEADVLKKPDYGEVGEGDDKIEWMLESPSAMYN